MAVVYNSNPGPASESISALARRFITGTQAATTSKPEVLVTRRRPHAVVTRVPMGSRGIDDALALRTGDEPPSPDG